MEPARRRAALALLLALALASAAEGARLEVLAAPVLGWPLVRVTSTGGDCIASSLSYDVRVQLAADVLAAGGTGAHWTETASARLDGPLCPGESRLVHVPLPFERGVVREARLARTDPGTDSARAVVASEAASLPFSSGPAGLLLARAGPGRLGIILASALAAALAAAGTRRSLAALWLLVVLLAAWARLPLVTMRLLPGADAHYNLHEAAALRDSGSYPPLGERLNPAYLPGFHYLLAALMLLTGGAGGLYLLDLLYLTSCALLARAARLPPSAAPLAALLLLLHPYHAGMTANLIPSVMSLSLSTAAVAAAVALPRSAGRGLMLLLVGHAVALSHGAGFAYLAILLACSSLWLAAGDARRSRALWAGLAASAAAGLAYYGRGTSDGIYLWYGLLAAAAAAIVGALAERAGGATPRARRALSLALALLLALSITAQEGRSSISSLLSPDQQGYRSFSAQGGSALALLALGGLGLLAAGEPLGLPLSLAAPAVAWGFTPVQLPGYSPMRLFLVSLLGLSLLGGRALDRLASRAGRERPLRRALLLLAAAGLVAAHLDRTGQMGEHARTRIVSDIADPYHPPEDVREAARFVEGRPEGTVLMYRYPTTLLGLVGQRLAIAASMPPVLDRAGFEGLCARPGPPLVVVDRPFELREPRQYTGVVGDLAATCYAEVYSNPSFRVFAARR